MSDQLIIEAIGGAVLAGIVTLITLAVRSLQWQLAQLWDAYQAERERGEIQAAQILDLISAKSKPSRSPRRLEPK